ncbi:MAG: four helix bundle protein [Akkermansiaceae bacterium]|nr:four helix bundle protein [Akkermansiaceae bacterium]MCP5545516.1 four helix bundle protein [Akkermansiaceae bacterium]
MDTTSFGYKKLRIWEQARELVIEIHRMTLNMLPKYEMYEEGSQIRRSMKSVKSNIVEGYGRRRHKTEYIRFLDFSYASALETIDHLETIFETESLKDVALFESLHDRLTQLSKSIYLFTRGVETHHNEDR